MPASGFEFWRSPPHLEEHEGCIVVRDDLLPGGSKMRFLGEMLREARGREHVFAGPFCGGAPFALALCGRLFGFPVRLFYADAPKRGLHPLQEQAQALGARLEFIPAGRISVVQARARKYCEASGARFLPLGFDLPEAQQHYVPAMRALAEQLADVRDVFCSCGSGMLARCLGIAFPLARVHAVSVGLASRHMQQRMPANVRFYAPPMPFNRTPRELAPFPSHGNYDRKAWLLARVCGSDAPRGSALFWNVLGDAASRSLIEALL